MQNLLIAAVVVIGGWWLLKQFGAAPPSKSAGYMRKLAGAACIGFAGLLTLRGGFATAVPLFIFGAGLIGANITGFPWTKKSPGQKSRVKTSLLVMELDHDSGRMDGEVLGGSFKGRRLTSLSEAELKVFHSQCAGAGDQSLALFQSWLDRAKPEWREAWGGAAKAAPASGAMSRDEALAVLGLKAGATADDVRAAHRRLMKDFHPDKGGSDYLAAKINQAKDVLL